MKNKKLAFIILVLFIIQLIIDIFYEYNILSKSLLYTIMILNALNFIKLTTRRDYAIFLTGVFCYIASILTRLYLSEIIYLSIFFPILAMIIHFWLYYKNKED